MKKKPPLRKQRSILIVDDHPMMREGLAQLINQFDDGWLNVSETPLASSVVSSSGARPRSPAPVAVNLSPVVVVPWIVPLPLSIATLRT